MDYLTTIIYFLVLSVIIIIVGFGHFLIQEAKKSNRKIGIQIEGVTRIVLATQYVIHVVAVFILLFTVALIL